MKALHIHVFVYIITSYMPHYMKNTFCIFNVDILGSILNNGSIMIIIFLNNIKHA